jgi:rfaE bifunctional protein nucleotidyltransferase chain/domain
VAHRDSFPVVALDAHDLRRWDGLNPTLITPSYDEALPFLSHDADRPRPLTALEHGPDLLAATGADLAAVTLDAEGAVLVGADGATHRTWAEPAPPGHAVGAGDAYVAALTLALSVGAEPPAAAELAQLAAAATVAGTGTCVCRRDVLLAAVGDRGSRTSIVDRAALARLVRHYRDRDACIVFTNGCFDVLHRGHVEYLEQARRLGDVLIVAMNSDASVRRLKGPERPINEAADRAAVLAALSCVDHVVVFEEDSPTALIELVRPDIYVKGGDYRPDLMPEAPLVRRLGGEVRSLTYVRGPVHRHRHRTDPRAGANPGRPRGPVRRAMTSRLVPDVRRIAVLRANALGDYIFALPALESLHAAYPAAELVPARSPLARRGPHRPARPGRPGARRAGPPRHPGC